MIDIRQTLASDEPAIESLLDSALGAERRTKTAYRLREGVMPVLALGRVAYQDNIMRGTISYWPMQISLSTPAVNGATTISALLLGPLAVDPDHRGEGIGITLMEKTLEEAKNLGHRLVILVGDMDYYSRVGFHRNGTADLQLPGPVDQERVLMKTLQGGEITSLAGMLEGVKTPSIKSGISKEHRA